MYWYHCRRHLCCTDAGTFLVLLAKQQRPLRFAPQRLVLLRRQSTSDNELYVYIHTVHAAPGVLTSPPFDLAMGNNVVVRARSLSKEVMPMRTQSHQAIPPQLYAECQAAFERCLRPHLRFCKQVVGIDYKGGGGGGGGAGECHGKRVYL